ncbi:MAG: beta-galactosidase [Candidatus Dormibacteria bacterium]
MRRGRWSALAAAAALTPLLMELRWRTVVQPQTEDWRAVPVRPRQGCQIGLSYRPRQAEALGLDPEQVLSRLVALPIDLVRVGAYWSRLEPRPGAFETLEVDRVLDALEAHGKSVVLAVGAVKTFGYPEYFVPNHRQLRPLPEGSLVSASSHPGLAAAARGVVARIVERYRERRCIVAWQVEHEAVDPLGMEHSWRLDGSFVAAEVEVVRELDPDRPILMNAYVPTSLQVRAAQRWRTRGQGDSLEAAFQLADLVGLDIYPRNAVLAWGSRALYLDGSALPWNRIPWGRLQSRAAAGGRRLWVAEGQAEPWERQTVPPDPRVGVPYSCPPERLILNYNLALGPPLGTPAVRAYLLWGLEYWLRREASGDSSYLSALHRLLEES